MIDLDKVIKGLEGVYQCVSPVNHTCGDCPYQDNHVECKRRVLSDALALLKEQGSVIETIKSDLNETLTELVDQAKSYEKKLKARDTEIDMLKRFLASLSFYHKSKDFMFVSDRAKICACGKYPVIMPYVLDSTCWVAQCKNCASRTVEAASPLQAVRFWNEDNLTEDTKLMRKPRDLDKGGIDHLAAALKKGAIKDLLWAERTGHLDSKIAEEARWWLKRDPKLIEDIESGAMRKRMEAMNEAEKKELEEDDLH